MVDLSLYFSPASSSCSVIHPDEINGDGVQVLSKSGSSGSIKNLTNSEEASKEGKVEEVGTEGGGGDKVTESGIKQVPHQINWSFSDGIGYQRPITTDSSSVVLKKNSMMAAVVGAVGSPSAPPRGTSSTVLGMKDCEGGGAVGGTLLFDNESGPVKSVNSTDILDGCVGGVAVSKRRQSVPTLETSGCLDMPDFERHHHAELSVEDQLVKSHELMETILSSLDDESTDLHRAKHFQPALQPNLSSGNPAYHGRSYGGPGGPLVFHPLAMANQQAYRYPPSQYNSPSTAQQQQQVSSQYYPSVNANGYGYFFAQPPQQLIPPDGHHPQQQQQPQPTAYYYDRNPYAVSQHHLMQAHPSLYNQSIPRHPSSPQQHLHRQIHHHPTQQQQHHQTSQQNHHQQQQPQKRCSNCGTINTPSWRRCPDGKDLLCNACGLYAKLHGRPRPFKRADDGSVRVVRGGSSSTTSFFSPSSTSTRQPPQQYHRLSPCDQCGAEGVVSRGGSVLCRACASYFQQSTKSIDSSTLDVFLASLVTSELSSASSSTSVSPPAESSRQQQVHLQKQQLHQQQSQQQQQQQQHTQAPLRDL